MQRANPSWAQFSARPRVKPRTYFQRSRPREAAEQYLKVTTDYAKSQRAPESMVRLGLVTLEPTRPTLRRLEVRQGQEVTGPISALLLLLTGRPAALARYPEPARLPCRHA